MIFLGMRMSRLVLASLGCESSHNGPIPLHVSRLLINVSSLRVLRASFQRYEESTRSLRLLLKTERYFARVSQSDSRNNPKGYCTRLDTYFR